MNNTTDHSGVSDGNWPHRDFTMPVPDTSMLPGADKPESAAVELMGRAAKGAHATIDRFVDSAAPTVRQLGESVSTAEEALHASTEQLREARDVVSESLRRTVRGNPLIAVGVALALGALIMRIKR